MSIIKQIGTRHTGVDVSIQPSAGKTNSKVVETSTQTNNFEGFDLSYAEFVRETRQGVADFVEAH